MNKIEMIEKLYFEDKMSLTDISKSLNVTVGYISKILKDNEKYLEEKQRRKDENLAKRRSLQKDLIYKNRKQKGIDTAYIALQKEHERASMELSQSSRLGTNAIRKWCSSAYKYNSSKRRYEFNAGKSLKPADLPQYIKI